MAFRAFAFVLENIKVHEWTLINANETEKYSPSFADKWKIALGAFPC
jgi:hypothetical protein